MAKNNTGIVILGVPRSGTTLVRRILNAHDNIASPGETCVLSACARFLRSETVADGLDFGVLSGLAFAGFDDEEVVSRLRRFATGFLEEYATRQGKSRWAEKTAVDVFYLNEIERLLTEKVQFVCVVRNGLDVACSIKEFSDRGFTYLSELHAYVKQHPRPLEAFAHAWADANSAMLDFVERHPSATILIRYEDLVSEPEKVTGELFGFLGETFTSEVLQRAFEKPDSGGFGDWKTYSKQSIDGSNIGRSRELPANTVSRLAGICNPVLERLGYDSVPIRKTDSQAVARRKYELAALVGKRSK